MRMVCCYTNVHFLHYNIINTFISYIADDPNQPLILMVDRVRHDLSFFRNVRRFFILKTCSIIFTILTIKKSMVRMVKMIYPLSFNVLLTMVIIKNPLTILIIMVRRVEDALNNLLLMYVIAGWY